MTRCELSLPDGRRCQRKVPCLYHGEPRIKRPKHKRLVLPDTREKAHRPEPPSPVKVLYRRAPTK